MSTDTRWPGRLGDHLLMYIKAHWFAQKTGGRFVYRPFVGSHALKLHEKYPLENTTQFSPYALGAITHNFSIERMNLEQERLYIASYQRDFLDQVDITHLLPLIRDDFLPKVIPNLPEHDPDVTVVALHIRTGGKKEQNLRPRFPEKFLPLGFYVQGLTAIAKRYPGKLMIYCFTDDDNPDRVISLIRKRIDKSKWQWHWWKPQSDYDKVAYDLYCMSRAHVFVRPRSNLSLMAELIGCHDFVISPAGPARTVTGIWLTTLDRLTRKHMKRVFLAINGWKPGTAVF